MIRKKRLLLVFVSCVFAFQVTNATKILIEAERFVDKGGWVIDQQFMDQMGSSYLLAHGMGKPVSDARTVVTFPCTGKYRVWVRTYNWTSPWTKNEGPGRIQLSVGGKRLTTVVGSHGNQWEWQTAGVVKMKKGKAEVLLHDLTGFDGRIDAICFVSDVNALLPNNGTELESLRRELNPLPVPERRTFELVVAGGGVAGMCAAMAAARLGLRVALINNRPVWGGNNSSEVRVHMGGYLNVGKYPQLGYLVREFGPFRKGNAQPASYYEDEKKQSFLEAEHNITLFPNYHVNGVKMGNGRKIEQIKAKHVENGSEVLFDAPLFIDCTGDGTVGFLAGADYMLGCESYDTYQETLAPKKFEKRTMGASVQWYSRKNEEPIPFPCFEYGINITDTSCQKTVMGEWTWETGMRYDQINEFERIRDYGLLVIYSNWSYLKNELRENTEYENRSLEWVAYVAGKRESRRLIGDVVLTENDLTSRLEYPDATAATSWSIDLHYPDPNNSRSFPGEEFLSVAKHVSIYPYDVPYRCLYSRNVLNLLMAGRHISVSHVALGTVRVMRTLGMLGEVVGMAAYVCHQNNILPAELYPHYFDKLQLLMKKGTGRSDAPDNQRYNQGSSKAFPSSQWW